MGAGQPCAPEWLLPQQRLPAESVRGEAEGSHVSSLRGGPSKLASEEEAKAHEMPHEHQRAAMLLWSLLKASGWLGLRSLYTKMETSLSGLLGEAPHQAQEGFGLGVKFLDSSLHP